MGERAIDLTHARQPLAERVDEAGTRAFGGARGLIHMADDFDAPLDDFRESMQAPRRPLAIREAFRRESAPDVKLFRTRVVSGFVRQIGPSAR